jgi:hypothetical protein
MRARNQVGIGLSYRTASLSSWATQFQTRFLESIPRPIAGLKFSTLVTCFQMLVVLPLLVPVPEVSGHLLLHLLLPLTQARQHPLLLHHR